MALAVLATDAALAKSQNELGLTTKAQELQQEQENADKVFQVKVKALEEWLSYQRAHHALPSEQDKTAAALGQLQVQYAGETATRSVAMGTEAGRGQQETDKQLAAISDKFDSPLTKVRSEYAEYMSYLSEAYNNALAAADAATTAGQEKIALLHATIMRVTAEEADAVRKAQSTMGSEDAQKAAGDIRSLWDTTFEHINKGTRGMVDAFASAFESILNKALATDLWNALGLDKILGGSTGGAGVLNNLFSGISGILGGLFTSSPAVAQGVAGDAATSAASGVVGSVLSGIGAAFFAGGGVTPGGLTMVGEEGPELVNLPSGSHVYSNSQSSDMLSASGGGATLHFSPVNNVNITANDADETRAQLIAYIDYTNKQQQKELYRTMQRNGLGSMR